MPDALVQSAIHHWAPRFVANGVPLADFEEVTASVTRWEDWCSAWSARAAVHEELAQAEGVKVRRVELGFVLLIALMLASLLRDDSSLNTWDVLIPFLTGTPFRRLDLVCDHVPRWLMRAMRALDMEAEIVELPGLGITATITRRAVGVVNALGQEMRVSGFRASVL